MLISKNNKEIIRTFILFIYTSIKITLSTLLSVFVIDTCEFTENLFEKCSFNEKIKLMTNYNLFVFSFNFFTLGTFIGFYLLEFYREVIFIKYLDIDETLIKNNLVNEVIQYPQIKNKLTTINNNYKKYTIFLILVNLINFCLSLTLLYIISSNIKIYINIFSNIFLVTDKLYSSFCIMYNSLKKFTPNSAYLQENVIFNTIDNKYKIKHTDTDFIIITKKSNSIKNIFEKYNTYNSRNTIKEINKEYVISGNIKDKNAIITIQELV
jgi:hypothetical protein